MMKNVETYYSIKTLFSIYGNMMAILRQMIRQTHLRIISNGQEEHGLEEEEKEMCNTICSSM